MGWLLLIGVSFMFGRMVREGGKACK